MLNVAEEIQLPVPQARLGDSDAWRTLFQRYRLPLYIYVFELLRDEQASLDVVQETFASAVRHIRQLEEDSKFASWLFSIGHNKCVRHWRRDARERMALLEEMAAPTEFEEGPDDLLIRKEKEQEFLGRIASLPLPQRSVLMLHYVEDFSLEQIAAITQTQLGTVKSRMHYAKRALRKLLETK